MTLYYYTTTDTMRYILTEGNIFATNMKYMNDSDEYINGLREVREWFINNESSRYSNFGNINDIAKKELTEDFYQKIRREDIQSYSISFSEAKDLLSQWFMYSKESGVSLEMEFTKENYDFMTFKNKVVLKDLNKNSVDEERGVRDKNYRLSPQKVYYFTKGMDEEEYKKVGKQISNAFVDKINQEGISDINEAIRKFWISVTPYVKRADFAAEKEYRIVFNAENARFTPRVDFRVDKNVIKPYLDITIKEGWPIVGIIVGPGFNQDAVYQSVVFFLSKGDIKVPITCEKLNMQINKYLENIQEKEDIEDNTIVSIEEEWLKKYGEFIKFNDINDANNVNTLHKEFQFFLIELIKTKVDEDNQMKIQENYAIQDYIENNYLSSKGIIVSKSKIPYLYV